MCLLRLPRIASRRSEGLDWRSSLVNEDLLEYEGRHGSLALCHLLTYWAVDEVPVCVVGNFDGNSGTGTRNAIEVVASAVADRLERNQFRLIEWHPRWSESLDRLSEVTLTPVQPTQLDYGEVLVGDPPQLHSEKQHKVLVRYGNPRWTYRTEHKMAKLLREEAIRDLRSYAGIPGDYTSARPFGSTGREKAKSIRAHNRQVFGNLEARISEWT